MSRHRQAALGEITPLASFVRCRFPTPPLLSPPCFAGGPRVAVEPTARSGLSNAPRAVVLDWRCDRPVPSLGPSAGLDQWRCALVRGARVLCAPCPPGALNGMPKGAHMPKGAERP